MCTERNKRRHTFSPSMRRACRGNGETEKKTPKKKNSSSSSNSTNTQHNFSSLFHSLDERHIQVSAKWARRGERHGVRALEAIDIETIYMWIYRDRSELEPSVENVSVLLLLLLPSLPLLLDLFEMQSEKSAEFGTIFASCLISCARHVRECNR